mmetsp:Transcript_625/g.1473  ORF Transcript_625/g.1473 Transcript_625/m.1473 type:complete len:325 (+) Transcript_625:48-1022(+)
MASKNDQEVATADLNAKVEAAQFYTVKPSELSLRGFLASGTFADVYLAEWTRSFGVGRSSIVVAVKQLRSDLGPVYRDREALALLTDHPNIVKCFDSTVDPPYLIVTEYCGGGNLFDLLFNSQQDLSTRQSVKFLTDVASGMQYLHSRDPCIVHRDLKSSNVLIAKPLKSTMQEPLAKVADFGLSRTSSSSTSTWADASMTVGVGTWRWMAPEVFDAGDLSVATTYDERADVFSYAIVMYEVLARKMPYVEHFPIDSVDPRISMHVCAGLRPNVADVKPEFPEELALLMQKSWDNEASGRPTFKEIEEIFIRTLDGIPIPGDDY